MDYKNIVEKIKEVTGLDVPVFYNDMDANCKGSPFFGIGTENCYKICPDIDVLPMLDIVDFIENKHIDYYHIALPDIIEHKQQKFVYDIIELQLKANGINIKLNKILLDLFIILHEFGHAHELFVKYKKNIQKYISETYHETSFNNYKIKELGLGGTKEGFLMHKELTTEEYADNFAISNFVKILNAL